MVVLLAINSFRRNWRNVEAVAEAAGAVKDSAVCRANTMRLSE
jgi:hypothetical protein